MLFTDKIKQHWLDKIEEKKEGFDPDYGCNCGFYGDNLDEPLVGAPLLLMTNIWGSYDWDVLEKEFQLPRWILDFITGYMHDINPEESVWITKTLFNSLPTYVDFEEIKHKFMLEILYESQRHSGYFVPSTYNRQTGAIYATDVYAKAITAHQLCAVNPRIRYEDKYSSVVADAYISDIFRGVNSEEGFPVGLVTACGAGYTEYAMSNMLTGKSLCGVIRKKDEEDYYIDQRAEWKCMFLKLVAMMEEVRDQ